MSTDGLLSPADVRALAAELGVRPTKQWGQNFVIDPNTIRRIVRLANVSATDTVLEIGPGLGSLTLGLLDAGGTVVAIEIDQRLAKRLPVTVIDRRPDVAANLVVVQDDAMAVPLPLRRDGTVPGTNAGDDRHLAPTVLVANLPYNVSVPVLLRLLAEEPTIGRAVVMVQAEVADRLTAGPGSRVYGAPSVKLQWYGSSRALGSVPPSVFWPVPRVESRLVGFERATPPAVPSVPLAAPSRPEREAVFACVDAAFSQRRKTLRQALAGWAGGAAAASRILESAQIDPAIRGELLTIGDFCRITDARTEQNAT